MPRESPEFWEKIRRAQKKIEDQFLNHLDVSLIDISYAPNPQTKMEEIILRIHVRERWMEAMPEERVAFPDQVDGIPVIVIPGDYRLENDGPGAGEE